jgi:predicted O-methyltransferase YrrM
LETAVVLERITGREECTPLHELFQDEFDAATQAMRTCPVKMGGAANLELLYFLAEHVGATTAIETGVAYGWSSLALLLSFRARTDSCLVSTDRPYPGTNSGRYVGCVVPESLKRGWHLIRRADKEALPEALKILTEIDICHYDSDKSRKGRQWAYPLLWDALKPGGFFVSDDVGDNLAFRHFCHRHGVQPLIVHMSALSGKKYVGILQKPRGH